VSRAKKMMASSVLGIVKQIVAMVCGFILPRYILIYYGSSVNGLLSSITYYLSFISLLDMGVGAVIQSNLYKPLADEDSDQISRIVKASKRFFGTLALIFLAYVAVLAPGINKIINTSFDMWFTASLVIIIATSTFVQYLFGITNQLLLSADQKAYVPLSMAAMTMILNTALSVVLMKAGASVQTVKLATVAVFVIRPVGQAIYVRRHYRINGKIEVREEPIKQKWNGFSQHFAAVVCKNVDVVALSIFSTLENVSVYSVYYLVTNGVEQLIMTAATGLEPLFGNMLARNETDKLSRTFAAVEWIVHTAVTVIFAITAVAITPFITVYTRGINDAEYVYPIFGYIIVFAYAAMCLRVPYFRLIKAAGHFKQTQNGAYISAAINIVLTVSLVKRFGLIGAAAGTFCALMYHTCYFAHYLKNNIISRPIKNFLKYLATDIMVSAATVFLCREFSMMSVSYSAWIVFALKVSLMSLASSVVINLLFHRKTVKEAVRLIMQSLVKSRG